MSCGLYGEDDKSGANIERKKIVPGQYDVRWSITEDTCGGVLPGETSGDEVWFFHATTNGSMYVHYGQSSVTHPSVSFDGINWLREENVNIGECYYTMQYLIRLSDMHDDSFAGVLRATSSMNNDAYSPTRCIEKLCHVYLNIEGIMTKSYD